MRHLALPLVALLIGCASPPQTEDEPTKVETARPGDSVEYEPGFPTEDDLARLESVMGKTAAEVVLILGEPEKVETRGTKERWVYPWIAACHVTFEGGIVVDTFYTGGY